MLGAKGKHVARQGCFVLCRYLGSRREWKTDLSRNGLTKPYATVSAGAEYGHYTRGAG